MVLRVFNSLANLEEWLKDIFIFQKILIENSMNFVKTLIYLILLEHVFACLWVLINHWNPDWEYYEQVVVNQSFADLSNSDELLDRRLQDEVLEESVNSGYMFDSYCDSLYFMTTTMTAVGYGDKSGFGKEYTMLYVMLI